MIKTLSQNSNTSPEKISKKDSENYICTGWIKSKNGKQK